MGTKMKGQLIFPSGMREDYKKEFWLLIVLTSSLHKDNIQGLQRPRGVVSGRREDQRGHVIPTVL